MFAFQAATFTLPTAFEPTVITDSNCRVLDSSHFATFSEWYKTDNNNGIAQVPGLAVVPMVIQEDDDELDELIELMASLSLPEDDDELEASMNDLVERMAELSTPDSEMDDKDEMEIDLPEMGWMDDKDNNNGVSQAPSLAAVPMVIEEDDDELDELIELMASLSLSEDDDELEASMNDLVERMADLSTPDSEMDDKDEMEIDPPEVDWMEVDCDEMEVDGP
ncbi:MAG: hypothetical protein SGBAC_012662 [Bacillariaceae sp.]